MHWGVRKDDYAGASKSTNNDARKDAKEFARAKQFYGEGAGTRRKLIKATVTGKSKKDATYAAAFNHHLERQNTADHASKAQSERKRKNARKSTAKTARGIRHTLNGNSQYASLAAAVIAGGAVYAHKNGIDKVILDAGKTQYSKAQAYNKNRKMTPAEKTLRDMGFDIG